FEPVFATARSVSPSPLKSPLARNDGVVPTAMVPTGRSEPSLLPRKTDTSLEAEFATTTSGSRSPLKSATVTDLGLRPTPQWTGSRKDSSPTPDDSRQRSSRHSTDSRNLADCRRVGPCRPCPSRGRERREGAQPSTEENHIVVSPSPKRSAL